MSDIMRPVPFVELLHRIVNEYRNHGSIFSISEDLFYHDKGEKKLSIFGQTCSTALGPAAGPHTQLAQNIVASYLVGGRFIELKTVQILDTLEVDKPCIDARDEGYNVEWSTEFTLPKAADEYIKAWYILHVLDVTLNDREFGKPSFIFNMSVGYNLEGIKTPRMQAFIDTMIDAGKDERFARYRNELETLLKEGLFEGTPWEGKEEKLLRTIDKISPNLTPSVTLSTMHGCPPAEIEAICSYMLTEKRLNTFVKLNPTLLGYENVRRILDNLGYDYITLKQESFDNDLQYPDAVKMLHRLVDLAKEKGLGFGVKLTNTLGSVNDQEQLPGEEMYMSGRALLPLSTNVGLLLSKEFDGKLPISYSGGATAVNVKALFECGIHPITLATDMLKPGGYTRLKQMVEILESSDGWKRETIDVPALEKLVADIQDGLYTATAKEFRGTDSIKIHEQLPLVDCYVAPCVNACAIHQDIPEYVQLVGEGRYGEALSVIYEKNALPAITSHICDHQCQLHCTRMDYEGAVKIRDMKRIAVERGFADYLQLWEGATEKTEYRAAVIGAGPGGLSAAYFLARAGFDTTVYEREESAGGVVRHVIPGFRLPVEAIESDVEFIKAHGVEFHFGVDTKKLTVETLKKQGFTHIFYAIGSEIDNELTLVGDRTRVITSLDFLGQFRKDPSKCALGKHVVVVGGGNTAMDGARAALRIPGVEHVSVIYRRTRAEMPADHEEFENARAEGAEFIYLANPEGFEGNMLTVRKMVLGEKDASGRRRPIPSDETFTIRADTMITAIGEKVDGKIFSWYGVPLNEKGWAITDQKSKASAIDGVYVIGDAQSGPSTVVRCIASARDAVEDAIDRILEAEGVEIDEEYDEDDHLHDEDQPIEELVAEEDEYFGELELRKSRILFSKLFGEQGFARREADRCMECSYICNKCVDVCPNRANVPIDLRNTGLFDNPFQILHLDAFCNECGNCETFCPYDGGPYKKKFTLFSRRDDFENSTNSGFLVEDGSILIRVDGKLYPCELDKDGVLVGEEEGLSDEVAAIVEEVFASYSYLLGEVEE
ncbi:MAG TPA: putative selenate reductase subunit YgfK [Sphaerochaeta sp.]|nr:putative selenate reductase subunit YgfK [Sphaerochaeta sp.]HQB04700.1 putative selenate reductase subunit YgfK [Sphaerochaeta sp.]